MPHTFTCIHDPAEESLPREISAMERLALVALIQLSLFFSVCAIAKEEPKSAESGKLQRVYSVTDVQVRTMESHPEQLLIEARGNTRAGGWTNAQLRRIDQAGKDGQIEVEFVALPPEGIATQAITPIKSTLTLQKPAGYKGVRVVAETNEKTSK